MTDDQHLFRCLKKMECASQGMTFEIPIEGSDAWRAMQIDDGEAWKMGSLISNLIWFRDKVSAAANRVYMQTRPELKDEEEAPPL